MINYRIALIRIFTFIGGLYFVLKFLLPEDNGLINFQDIHEYVVNGFTVVGSLAIGLGIINLIFVHGGRLVYKKSNWIFSAVLLAGLVTMLTTQGINWYKREQNAQKASRYLMLAEFSRKIVDDSDRGASGVMPRLQREQILLSELVKELDLLNQHGRDSAELDDFAAQLRQFASGPAADNAFHQQLQQQLTQFATLYREELDKVYSAGSVSQFASFLNNGLFVSLGSAMFSLLGFYIAAAAYRAFRIRSVEASLMMISALIVMLGQIPFGLWIYPHFPELRMWLLQVPSAGAARAIEVGSAIAGLVLAIRMWLSLESESFKS